MPANEVLTGARTMWELVERRATASPDRPMLIGSNDERLTFGELRDRAERVAAGLGNLGVEAGSYVSWQLPTRVDTIVLSMALCRLGAVQNPIIHLYRQREVGFALRQTGASHFFVPSRWRDTDYRALAEEALDGTATRPEIIVLDDQLPEGDPSVLPPPPDPTDPGEAPIRWIYYTSGSTADPKGVPRRAAQERHPVGCPTDTDEQLANRDGRPVDGAEVRVLTLDGRVAGPSDEGEITVRGPMVFRGYTDAGLNAAAFTADGFFRTGDLGVLRADGHLSLTGRIKDVIVRKGENISAKEIEDVLYTHPDVMEVAVVGLPDPTRGEMVCAVVQLAEGASGLDLGAVVAFCRDAGLMTQKIPERLEVRREWPRSGTGKIVKKSLRDEYAS